MTTDDATLRFLVLGPVEARVGARALELGGAKQRTVLALLVLRAGKPIPIERLIDDLWAESPPPSAAHTVEGYVSRLRRALEPFGAAIERRGDGYRLELGTGSVDAALLEALVADAEEAAERGDDERAARLAAEAVGLWRGPALVDVRLPAEADRLEELRLRALEQRFDAELRLGRHASLIAELRRLVAEHRHRERLVAQLMVALYRSGRHAEALDVYEATRRSLGDELGLQPSADLRRLSGEIVRQEPSLLVPVAGRSAAGLAGRSRVRRFALVAVVGAVAAGAAGVLLTRAAGENSGRSTRVLLLLHRAPAAGFRDPVTSSLVEGLNLAERRYGVSIETLVVPEGNPAAPAAVAATKRLRSDPVDLVIAPLRTIFSLGGVPDFRGTRFVSVDVDWPQALPRNTTAFVFDDRQSGYLVGYLSGLMERRRGARLNERHVVSLIGGDRVPPVERMLDGFTEGVRRALPDVTVLRRYSSEWVDQSRCDQIANEQIDAGSDIVFPAAGYCGFGALSAAGIRGAWGIGFDGDRSYLGRHILASADKRFDEAVLLAVQSFLEETLPRGERVVLGLDDNAVGIVGIDVEVPDAVRKRVAQATSELRRGRVP